jgi:predicted chitinase
MIISPPILKTRTSTESDGEWISRVMAFDELRGFPVSAAGSWHGGIHILHTDKGSKPEQIRAIAEGKVVSFRIPANDAAKCSAPLNLNGATDSGYVLLKHETEIGSGENGKVIFFSLYMHLKSLNAAIKSDAIIHRKDAIGTAGMVDGKNAFHFQIFCDDTNIEKLTGRTTQKLDITQDGRTDAIYGDIHFVLPVGTKFYNKGPDNNSTATEGLNELHTSTVPLYASMTLAKGSCTMVTRQEDASSEGRFNTVGEALVDADGAEYEYNLYKTAVKRYQNCPSAGYELLRFGRIINAEHETLVPADAPLWMTINYPGGKGVVNLAVDIIKKFSDADFPHWTGWQLVDDDTDSNSQCNSAAIAELYENGDYDNQCGKLICHFPFEWEKSTVDARFSWLKTGSDEHDPMSEEDYAKFKAHSEALCFNSGSLASGRLWHFEPKGFIRQFKKCVWIDDEIIEKVMAANTKPAAMLQVGKIKEKVEEYYRAINTIMNKYNLYNAKRQYHFLGQGSVESGYLLVMQELSQEQFVKDGMNIGGGIVADSRRDENTDLGHWYGFISTEVDEYFSGNKYNSKGGLIAGSYSWKNGNCGDVDAQKFRGRGFKMLTGLDTYSSYWVYRGWLKKGDFDSSWWTDAEYKKHNKSKMKKLPPNIELPHKVTENPYNCIDTGGFFIACFKSKVLKTMDSDLPGNTDDDEKIEAVTKGINGADKGIRERKISTKKAKELIDDQA